MMTRSSLIGLALAAGLTMTPAHADTLNGYNALQSQKQQLTQNRNKAHQKLSQLQQQRNQLILQQNTGQGIQFGQQMNNVIRTNTSALTSRNTGFITIDDSGVSIDGAPSDLDADALRSIFGLSQDKFHLLVIGKSNSVLLKSNKPVSGEKLLKTIDKKGG